MKSFLKAVTIFLLLLSTGVVFGQQVKAKYEIGYVSTQAKVGDTIEVFVKITPPMDWHIYSNRNEGCEYAPIEAQIDFIENKSYKVVGGLRSIGAKGKMDSIFECKIWSFDHEALFKQKVVVLSKDLKITGDFQGQMCDDAACVPLFPDTFVFTGISIVE